ncbi:hypothetical protein [Mycolicibacterium sp. XJ1819]
MVRGEAGGVRDAVRFGLVVAGVAIVFLATAVVWVSTCTGATADTVACGVPQRALLAVGTPVILLLGAARAFVGAHRTRRRTDTWWGWQIAGCFLLTLMLAVLAMSMPSFADTFGVGFPHIALG